jgi:hypothetical protein
MVHRLGLINGFHVHASDGHIGHVDDFLLDESSFNIRYIVVDTSNWLGGKWVAVAPSSVKRIDWSNRELHMSLTRAEIRDSPTMEEAQVPSYELVPRFVIM